MTVKDTTKQFQINSHGFNHKQIFCQIRWIAKSFKTLRKWEVASLSKLVQFKSLRNDGKLVVISKWRWSEKKIYLRFFNCFTSKDISVFLMTMTQMINHLYCFINEACRISAIQIITYSKSTLSMIIQRYDIKC